MTTYHCPNCNGTNVQELNLVWINPNTGKDDGGEAQLAELYTDRYWCDDCEDSVARLIEQEN